MGLESPVIKSHGSTDYIGFANSLDVCQKTVKGQLIDKIKKYYSIVRQNLTKKKEIVNSIYMQLGYPKNLIENILEDIFDIILDSDSKNNGKVKISNFGTFILRHKNQE